MQPTRTLTFACWLLTSVCCVTHDATQADEQIYLFASFRGNGEDGLHLAYSRDAIDWTALNQDKSFLKPDVGGKLMRDPCIIQGPGGMFHMVWTTSWNDNGIGIAHSQDLVHWSPQAFVPVMEHEPTARNCWAPEIAWDPAGQQYVLYWATTVPQRFSETATSSDKGAWNHRIYSTTTKDFETYTETRLFYEPGFNVIDSTITRFGERYVMITKNETPEPPAKNLFLAMADRVTGPWENPTRPFTPPGVWVEGPTILKAGDYWYVYFDCYREHRYGAMRTKTFQNWENVSEELSMPPGTRHGTALAVPEKILKTLIEH